VSKIYGGDEMSDHEKRKGPDRHSWSVDGAAARWEDTHPDEAAEHPAPSAIPEDEEVVPNRHSASAEAASLRWHEQQDD
jgi:hypothetical protein